MKKKTATYENLQVPPGAAHFGVGLLEDLVFFVIQWQLGNGLSTGWPSDGLQHRDSRLTSHFELDFPSVLWWLVFFGSWNLAHLLWLPDRGEPWSLSPAPLGTRDSLIQLFVAQIYLRNGLLTKLSFCVHN